tara:strand:+ start:146 stop:571 length:426 start_codon:yes stop_codon:yes gene_type:complete
MTVAKSTTRKTTPRKTRTRKSSPKVTKSTAQVDKVIKEIQEVLDTPTKKVTPLNTPSTATVVMNELNKKVEAKGEQPVKVRPNSPKLSRADYLEDVKIRWAIHEYEIQELGKDLVKGYQLVVENSSTVVNYIKTSYNRAFN